MPNRIKPTDTMMDVVAKLSQGVPGAAVVLAEWIREGERVDPDAGPLGWMAMMAFDDNDIVGSSIWVLYKDVAGQSLVRFLGILRANQLGYVSPSELQSWAVRGVPPSPEFVDGLLARVRAELPAFAQTDDVPARV